MYKLLQPLNTGKLNFKNRLIMPPMATAKSSPDGKVTKELIKYYDEKTKGGYFSAVIIEHSFITQQGKSREGQLSAADDDAIPGLSEIAKIIHSNDTLAIMQINHSGSDAQAAGMEIVGPSAVIHPNNNVMPKMLSKEEISIIISQFASAAKRAVKAGFDGVEIHSCHGYLLNQFLSPITNKRTDEYGGDVFERIKMHLEVIKAVREAVGYAFPVFLRLGASDYMDGGITIEDSIIASVEFEKAGVDVLDISGGMCRYSLPHLTNQGYFSPLSKEIKKVVSIPVILTGGITQVEAAERILKEEKADLIGVGRAVLKDSSWAKNAIESIK